VKAACYISVAFLSGCSSLLAPPDVKPVERALAVAVPVAYVATLANAAFAGQPAKCTSVLGPIANIEVSDACPLPMVDGAQGNITVTSIGSSAAAIYAAVFTSVDIGARTLQVKSVDAITAVTRDTMLEFTYFNQDVKLTNPDGAEVMQSSWILMVDPRGTPGDPSDDAVTIDGARQVVDNGHTTQTALTNVKMDGCRQNPVAGQGTIETADGGNALGSTGVTTVSFHPACDGRAKVELSVSSSFGSTGSTVALDLL
jgi:hypothetical protein